MRFGLEGMQIKRFSYDEDVNYAFVFGLEGMQIMRFCYDEDVNYAFWFGWDVNYVF
jgi:hypothetical protein